jgi:hypothetical protein
MPKAFGLTGNLTPLLIFSFVSCALKAHQGDRIEGQNDKYFSSAGKNAIVTIRMSQLQGGLNELA